MAVSFPLAIGRNHSQDVEAIAATLFYVAKSYDLGSVKLILQDDELSLRVGNTYRHKENHVDIALERDAPCP